MKLNCGIIGLPNVGKSTLFSILTNATVKIANYPFCTIAPNIATIYIPDSRIYQLAKIAKSQKMVFNTIEFVDIAGLIKGAYRGEGLGGKILTYIREVKVLLHVVRCFSDNNIAHITGNINPSRDINIINTELILFDMLQCEKNIALLKRNNKFYKDDIQKKLSILDRCLTNLNHGILLRKVNFTDVERIDVQKFNFLTFKPIIYIANTDITGNHVCINILNIIAANEDTSIISCCSPELLYDSSNIKNYQNNNQIDDIKQKRRKIFQDIIDNIFDTLDARTFFTINTRMTHAWIGNFQTTALEAANKVHNDFKKGFIRVQVIKYQDFIDYVGEQEVKKMGKIYSEGKDYFVQDGDILKFLFSKK